MIDRVAAAILGSELGGDAGMFIDCTLEAQNRYREIARAAIAAMREPTPEMLNAEMDLGGYGYSDGECYCADPSDIWRAMVVEALK
jgi:hypothetical protein